MEIKIPENFSVIVQEDDVKIKYKDQEYAKKFNKKFIQVALSDRVLKVISTKKKETRKVKAILSSFVNSLINLFKTADIGFHKSLQIVFSHFPVTVEVKDSEVLIKNFLGEKVPRVARIIGNTKVEAKGQEISVKGDDKESVGQTAANIVLATKIKEKDRRIFQDGIYYST